METPSIPPSSSAPNAQGATPAGTDWTEIERVYRTTNQSLREIAEAHGLTHSAIGKRARARGWGRPQKESQAARAASTPSEIARLQPREQRFVQEYLVDLNGTQAYMRVEPGTTEKSARTLASRMLAKVNVQEAISVERAKAAAQIGLTRERVLAEYAKLAFFDMRQAYHPSGTLKQPHELDEATAAAIAGYETVELDDGGKDTAPLNVRKVKWADRRGALDSIMKAQGWNRDVGTQDNPLVIRNLSSTERAVRLARALQGSPELAAAVARMVADKEGA